MSLVYYQTGKCLSIRKGLYDEKCGYYYWLGWGAAAIGRSED